MQLMYRNVRSRVKVNGTFSDDFLVQVGLHQASVLCYLLLCCRYCLEKLGQDVQKNCSMLMIWH